jgi:hypothetical protein
MESEDRLWRKAGRGRKVGKAKGKRKTHETESCSGGGTRPSPKRDNPVYLGSQQVLKRIGEDVFRVWSFVLVFFFLLLRRSSKVIPVRPRVPRHTARSTFVRVL